MKKLRRIRAEKGLTMDALEERTGVSKRTISEIERGMRTPQTLTLAKLANALGVELDDLLEEEAPKAQAPSTSPKEATEAGPDELSANDLADLCGELYAELQQVRETPAEDLKAQVLGELDAELKEAQAALSTAINRGGPARLTELSMQRVIRQRRRKAQQSAEDAASEAG